MGDTATGSWGSRELGAHIQQEEVRRSYNKEFVFLDEKWFNNYSWGQHLEKEDIHTHGQD